MSRSSYASLEVPLVVRLSEYLRDVDAVGLSELAGRLPDSLFVEDPLHRVEHICAILGRGYIGQCSILMNHGDDLGHLCFRGPFRVLDLSDLFIAFLSQSLQIVPEV